MPLGRSDGFFPHMPTWDMWDACKESPTHKAGHWEGSRGQVPIRGREERKQIQETYLFPGERGRPRRHLENLIRKAQTPKKELGRKKTNSRRHPNAHLVQEPLWREKLLSNLN